MELIDLTGQRFGRWEVLKKAPPGRKGSAYWVCKCDCGTIRDVCGQQLRKGNSKSCGCLHYEQFADSFRTHGKTKTRLYNIWSSMRERCYCKTASAYKYYGGKGIGICEEWQDYSAFEKWALENGYDPTAKSHQCTIDRIDSSKGYSPDNCRWVDSTVQSNNVSNNIRITYEGKTQTLAQWAREKDLPYHFLYDRIVVYGWSAEKAFTQPHRGWGGGRCRNSE